MTGTEPPEDGPGPPPDGAPGPVADGARPPGGRTRTWIVVLLVGVALVTGVATAVIWASESAGIPDGTGTATIAWTPVVQGYPSSGSSAPQPFTGEIAGRPVSGTSTLVVSSGAATPAGQLPTGPTPIFRYRGIFAGSPFDLTVSFAFPMALGPGAADTAAALAATHFTVTGTYGHAAVHATVSSSSGGPSEDRPARLTGTVGNRKVVGTISPATGTSTHQSVTARFVVSG